MKDQEGELTPYRLTPQQREEHRREVNQEIQELRTYWIEHESPFVSEGRVIVCDLGHRGFMPPIPDGESAITALVMGPKLRLYGATSGRRSHLFVYRVGAHHTHTLAYPVDLGVLAFEGIEQSGCKALDSRDSTGPAGVHLLPAPL